MLPMVMPARSEEPLHGGSASGCSAMPSAVGYAEGNRQNFACREFHLEADDDDVAVLVQSSVVGRIFRGAFSLPSPGYCGSIRCGCSGVWVGVG